MDRRTFIGTAGALVALPSRAGAQREVKVWRVGFLLPGTSEQTAPVRAEIRQALQERGYVEGKNVEYVAKMAEGRPERLPQLAAELVGLGLDVIMTGGSEATRAAKQATPTIPIVFWGPSYPVEEGLVASFARPGGNITGLTVAMSDTVSKHLQLLRDVVPSLADAAIIWSPANPGNTFAFRDTERAAAPMQLKIHSVPIANAGDVESAVDTIARLKPGALIVQPSAAISLDHVQRIAEHAIKLRVPSISIAKAFSERGLLMSYGADPRDIQRRIPAYVAQILRGAKPADLPVERPTNFELVINERTAKALGLTIPQTLLLRADEVIR